MADARRLIRRLGWALSILPMLVLLLAALYLAADAEGLGAGYERFYPYVFGAVALAALVLGIAIVQRILRLLRDVRQGLPGARLSRRLLLWLLVLALPPIILVHLFASRFILSTVDSWLRTNSAEILQQSLDLGRAYLDLRLDAAGREVEDLADDLAFVDDAELVERTEQALDRSAAAQLAWFDAQGRLLALAAATPQDIDVDPPDEELRLALSSSDFHAEAEPFEGGLRIRVVQRVQRLQGAALLQALYRLPPEYSRDLAEVEQGVAEVRRSLFLRDALKFAFVLILTLVLLLSVLLSVFAALGMSRRLVSPIGRLAAAMKEVSDGHFDRRIPELLDDELGLLVKSFNRMARDLELTSAQAKRSQEETERQRAFLETVLARLSSVVLVIDATGQLTRLNPAALAWLGDSEGSLRGQPLGAIARARPQLAALVDKLGQRLREGVQEFRDELVIAADEGRELWLLRGTRLPDQGLLAVLDDTTMIDRARRDAAWAEVARRLAHEVKNPLTPIQLAAERLRRRVMPSLAEEEAEVLSRATHTIVAQVDALKTLVNAFGDYARPPQLQRQPMDLAVLIRDLIELYAGDAQLRLQASIENELPVCEADPGRLRQVLHNLIKNAKEAAGEQQVQIVLGARRISGGQRGMIELWVQDDGPGLPDGFDASWFEPYKSTKLKGTGLGLAIVRKIAEEHGGQLLAETPAGGGARFILRLPV
ncbi:sensor histidine kinase [Pseudomarimonas arenosa]|uniref:histidine kinase n=1 Tax=Pseudomarimonas arenosa TaxID=2774145 RepID=A0AAW3ZGQ0_9GAMM|nr:ATP-binding protein [Pseudomarimonas arenosa]MBD8525208.1 HAMP domain-containing protein [Pseudomarimonas arenosa]